LFVCLFLPYFLTYYSIFLIFFIDLSFSLSLYPFSYSFIHSFFLVLLIYQGSISSTFLRSFYVQRSDKCKKYGQAVNLFALLGSALVKAACKMLMKLTPCVNFINVKRTNFLYKHCFLLLHVFRKSCRNVRSYEFSYV